MEYIKITAENIEKENICCAISNNKSKEKKAWLLDRFADGLVFYKSAQRGKCFIEYIPAEKAWLPIIAPDYLHINCLWVSGSLKHHGYSNDLLEECLSDAKKQGKAGLCILSALKKNRSYLVESSYLTRKGFILADTTAADIVLMYMPLRPNAKPPKFKDSAKTLQCGAEGLEKGFTVYYSSACPFTAYWVPVIEKTANEHGIPLKTIHINSLEQARNLPAPFTNYALFKDRKFITHCIQSDKMFLKLAATD